MRLWDSVSLGSDAGKMNVVGRVGSLISQGVTTVASPFHPFGGAVDIIVVQREDGTYRSTPWCVRFGKFQGVLKVSEKIVSISVNGVDTDFHMYLDNSGEAYFLKEVDTGEDANNQDEDLVSEAGNGSLVPSENGDEEKRMGVLGGENELEVPRQDFGDKESTFIVEGLGDERSSEENEVDVLSSTSSYRYDNIVGMELSDGLDASQSSESEVILMTVDGHLIMAPAPVSSSEDMDNVQLSTPQFYLVSHEESGMRIEGVQESNGYQGEESEAHVAPVIAQGEHSAHSAQEFAAYSSNALPEGISDLPNKDHVSGISPDTHVGTGELPGQIKDTSSSREDDEFSPIFIRVDSDGSGIKLPSRSGLSGEDVFQSCLALSELAKRYETEDQKHASYSPMGPPEREPIPNLTDSNEHNHASLDSDILDGAFRDTEDGLEKEASPSHTRETTGASTTEFKASPNFFEDSTTSSDKALENQSESMTTLYLETGKDFRDGATGNMDNSKSNLSIPPERLTHDLSMCFEISLCGSLLYAGMGFDAAAEAFKAHQISKEEFKSSSTSIIKNKNLIIKCRGKYLPWEKAASIILGMAAFGFEFPSDPPDTVPVEQEEISRLNVQGTSSLPSRGWRFWPIQYRRVKTLEQSSTSSLSEVTSVASEALSQNPSVKTVALSGNRSEPPRKQFMRTNIPTSEQLASLKLKDGQNIIAFSFSTRVLGKQQVDARIYLWKSSARIVISDVDGTITKSDVLGQFMPLVGKDWTQSGVAKLFSSIKENGYQLLFLSARAIVQAYLTRNFLHNLKQDGKALPSGPVFISPDGLSYSFIREVVRRKPHEFKIACLEEIRALFPPDYNPFYAGFGNRDTDELSYRKVGIPKGKIFIINPKGEVATNNYVDSRSYFSLHTLVNDMFPPTSLTEQEDFNSWNYWKLPVMNIEI